MFKICLLNQKSLHGNIALPIGNHKIEFKDKTFEALANEIKEKLDSLEFEKCCFLERSGFEGELP